MIPFVLAGVAALLVVAAGVVVWRKWIEPWANVEQALAAIDEGRQPRGFLFRGNRHAQRIGFRLERLHQRDRDRAEKINQDEFSVRTILAAMPDGLLVVDEARRIRLMNPQFQRLFDSAPPAAGAQLVEVLRDSAVAAAVEQTLATGEARLTMMKALRNNGENRDLEVVTEAIGGDGQANAARGAVILFRDVTQLRQVERIRRDFVANVSHELRTPLSIFRGYLETLLENPKQPPRELMRIFETMERHSNRLNLLVEDVLSLARLEAPDARLQLETIKVKECLADIVRDWEKKLVAKQLHCELVVGSEVSLIQVDEGRLQEMIYNLLDNSVKYSPAGGLIRIEAVRDGEFLRISVSDTGPGISARDLPRIFERFYRADKARSREIGGTGLGLSIVKHIAQLHGGNVDARSKLGEGTTVSVFLPWIARAAQVDG